MDKGWESDNEEGLAMSFLLKNAELDEVRLLSVIAGIGVSNALGRIYKSDLFSIKWPNDVLASEKKICGILCETKVSSSMADAVCGIGINVSQDEAFFEKAGLPYATSLLLAAGKPVKHEILAASVLNEIEKLLHMYRDGKWPDILSQFRHACINLGRQVKVSAGEKMMEGIAEDLTDDGELIVRCGEERIVVNSGEAHVRGLYGYV